MKKSLYLTLILLGISYLFSGSKLGFISSGYAQTIEDSLVFSNYFSPNGDGQNDTFVILNAENCEDCQLSIFNRWGDLVYESKAYKNDWNGKSNAGLKFIGKELPEGIYFYVFKTSSGKKFNGKVTLKR